MLRIEWRILFRKFLLCDYANTNLWLWWQIFFSLIKREWNEFKELLVRQLCKVKQYNECVPLPVSANINNWPPLNAQFGMVQRNGVMYHHVLWPEYVRSFRTCWHPYSGPGLEQQTGLPTPDTMCHYSNHYGGLGYGYGGFGGLGFGRGCGCSSFRSLGFGSGFGGYGCGSGFGSFGSGCCHRPLFFRRCGFSSFY